MDIYVSNLSFQVDDAALNQFFADFGEVRKATVVKDRETGKSRGFGFVDMPDPESAKRAIMNLNGKPLMGRPVNVTEARPRPPGTERRPMGTAAPIGSFSSGAGRPPSSSPAPRSSGPPSAGGFGGSAPRPNPGFSAPPRGFGSEPEEGGDDRSRRVNRAERHHQSGPKAKKPGARFEEVRRPKILKGNGDDKWRPNLKAVTDDEDDDDTTPPRVR